VILLFNVVTTQNSDIIPEMTVIALASRNL
jgi:hypothetical protein